MTIIEKAGSGHRARRQRERNERRLTKALEGKIVTKISEGIQLIQCCVERPNKANVVVKVKLEDLPDPFYQRKGFADFCGNTGGGAMLCKTNKDQR